MQARMKNPAYVNPQALQALQSLNAAIEAVGLDPKLLELINLRASQINSCGVCLVHHPRLARKLGESDERIFGVAGWREAPFYNDAERAALALTEAVTRLSDRADPVPDAVWDAAARQFNEQELSALLLAITAINVWNRLNVATQQVAGQGW